LTERHSRVGGTTLKSIRCLASAGLLALVSCTLCSAGNLVINGSFEADSCAGSGNTGERDDISGGDMTGWWIPTSGTGEYPACFQNSSGLGPAADGDQWVALGQWSAGVDYTIQQTLTGLVPFQTYYLSFSIASEVDCCAVAEVSFLSGSSTAPQDFTAPSSASLGWRAWGANTMDFVATSSSVTLQFKDLNIEHPNGYVLGLDAVDVEAATPEPGYGLLAGFALLGLVALRLRSGI
jgi:hypothetical protein